MATPGAFRTLCQYLGEGGGGVEREEMSIEGVSRVRCTQREGYNETFSEEAS
jgi:hypothetical protein